MFRSLCCKRQNTKRYSNNILNNLRIISLIAFIELSGFTVGLYAYNLLYVVTEQNMKTLW
jgi:hypothetical protein